MGARRRRHRGRPPRRRALAYYLYVKGKGADIRGSSTVEFVPTEPPPKPVPKPRPKPGSHVSPVLTRVDWPTFGYDGRRLRSLPSPLRPPFRVEWTEFPPAVAYGRVYVANNPGTLFAVSAKTGRLGWRFASGRCTAASPAVANGIAYEAFLNKAPCNQKPGTKGIDGEVVALDAKTGAVVWRHRIGPSETSPLVADGRVYVGDWNGPISGSATVLGNIVYFSTLKGRTYGLDPRTGPQLWTFADGKYSPLVASPERVYLTGYTKLYGLVPDVR